MQNIINLNNENERLKAQNQSLQNENRVLREKLINSKNAFNAILNGSLPCDKKCTPEIDCFDEVTNYGDTCMIRLAQNALKEIEELKFD